MEKIIKESVFIQETKIVDVIIAINKGRFSDYKEYLDFCEKEREEYMKAVNAEFSRFQDYKISIPLQPAPIIKKRLFDYIKSLK